MDQLQFAYQKNKSTADAILILLHSVLSHLDKSSRNYARILFLDFASAFNTMVPDVLINKMLSLNIPTYLCLWTLNFLLDRRQYVKHSEGLSTCKRINTGSPQGCVLSPILFVMYTNELTATHSSNILLKFADDTAIVGRIAGDDASEYHDDIGKTIRWCQDNQLHLNVRKTKEVVIDFRKSKKTVDDVTINGSIIEKVSHYKYLGVYVDDKLSLAHHAAEQKKIMARRMYCVKTLRKIGVSRFLIQTAYNSFVGSVINYCSQVFLSLLSNKDRRIFLSVLKEAERMGLEDVSLVENKIKERAIKSVQDIICDPRHYLHEDISSCLASGRTRSCSRMIYCRTERFLKSMIPDTLKALSNSL